MTADRRRLCDDGAVPDGGMMRFEFDDIDPVLLCNVEGILRAVDDECTHAIASLSDGRLDGAILFCPMHGGSFDIRTGKAKSLPCKQALRVHSVEVADGAVWLLVP